MQRHQPARKHNPVEPWKPLFCNAFCLTHSISVSAFCTTLAMNLATYSFIWLLHYITPTGPSYFFCRRQTSCVITGKRIGLIKHGSWIWATIQCWGLLACSVWVFLNAQRAACPVYSLAEARRRGLRSGGRGKGWLLPATKYWPREASWAGTGSQTNCKEKFE